MQDIHSIGGGGGGFFIGGGGGGNRRIRTHHHNHVPAAARCPRCDSINTKFCYYNNYNLSQPRHFCKSCRRYWTKGGVLRNVPIGGGCRKSKRPASKPNPPSADQEKEEEEEAAESSEKPPIISQAVESSEKPPVVEIAWKPRSAVAVSDFKNGILDSVSVTASASEAVTERSMLYGTSVSPSNSFSGLINGTGNSNLYGGVFSEIGSLSSLNPPGFDQTTAFGLEDRTVNQIQVQRENEIGIFYDPFNGGSLCGNGGFGPLDWTSSGSD